MPDRPQSKLEQIGSRICLGSDCVDTRSGVRADYEKLRWEVRKAMQFIAREVDEGKKLTVEGLKQALGVSAPTLLGNEKDLGYAEPTDLKRLIDSPKQTASDFALQLISDRLRLTYDTVLTYTKRRRTKKTPK